MMTTSSRLYERQHVRIRDFEMLNMQEDKEEPTN